MTNLRINLPLATRKRNGLSHINNSLAACYSLGEALAIGLILFAVAGMALSQTLPSFPIQTWNLLLFASLIAGALIELGATGLRRRQVGNLQTQQPMPVIAGRSGILTNRWVALTLFGVFTPAFLSKFLSVRMQLGGHGYFHSAYIYQILNGFTPPENVTLPGYPANFYWYLHALLAALSSVTNTAPPLVSTVFVLFVMLATLALVKHIVRLLLPTEERVVVVTLLAFFALFSMNLFGLLHALYRAVNGEPWLFFQGTFEPVALFGDQRLTILLTTFLNFGGFAVGVLCFTFVLLVVIRLYAQRATGLDLLLAMLAVFAALALHAVTGVFLSTAVPFAVAGTYFIHAARQGRLFDRDWHVQQGRTGAIVVKANWKWTLAIVLVGSLLTVPTLHFLFGASETLSTRPSLDFVSLFQLKSIFSMVYPLLPFFSIAAIKALRDRHQALVFLSVLSLIGLALGYLARIENNQYKFIYLSAITMSIVCTVSIWRFLFRPGGRVSKVGRAVALLMMGIMFVNILALGFSRLNSPYVQNDNFMISGIHVNSRTSYEGTPYPEVSLGWTRGTNYPDTDLQYADLFQWARDNTSPDVVLVVPLMHKDQSALPLLSERLPYVVDGLGFNDTLPDYEKRTAEISVLYSATSSLQARQEALNSIGSTLNSRDKLLVYPADLPELPSDEPALHLLFRGRYANLYRIVPGLNGE
jgi:hypothetical protein